MPVYGVICFKRTGVIKEREEITMEILITCLVSLIAALIIFIAIRSRKITIRDWLMLAVTEAEKQLGSGTGQQKLKRVYVWFTERFSVASYFVSFELFSAWVDSALEIMERILEIKEGGNGEN